MKKLVACAGLVVMIGCGTGVPPDGVEAVPRISDDESGLWRFAFQDGGHAYLTVEHGWVRTYVNSIGDSWPVTGGVATESADTLYVTFVQHTQNGDITGSVTWALEGLRQADGSYQGTYSAFYFFFGGDDEPATNLREGGFLLVRD